MSTERKEVKRNHSEGLPEVNVKENTQEYTSKDIRQGYKDWRGSAVKMKCLKTASWSVAPYRTRKVKLDEVVVLTNRRTIDLIEREGLGVIVDDKGKPIAKQQKAASENKSV